MDIIFLEYFRYEIVLYEKGAGITLPGRGITVYKGAYSGKLDMQLISHEFGHTLQIGQLGSLSFLKDVGIPSFRSAAFSPGQHNSFWTEVWANRLANHALEFSTQFKGPWNYIDFPLTYRHPNDILNVLNLFKR